MKNKYRLTVCGHDVSFDVPEIIDSPLFDGFLSFTVSEKRVWHVPRTQIQQIVEITEEAEQ